MKKISLDEAIKVIQELEEAFTIITFKCDPIAAQTIRDLSVFTPLPEPKEVRFRSYEYYAGTEEGLYIRVHKRTNNTYVFAFGNESDLDNCTTIVSQTISYKQ